MNFFEKYFERILRKKVKEHEFSFDPSSWEKMEVLLDTNPTTTPLHRSAGYITFMIGSILTIFLSLYYSQVRNTSSALQNQNGSLYSQYIDTNSPSNLDEFEISETQSIPLFIDFQAKEELLRLGDWMNNLWNNTIVQHSKTKLSNITASSDLTGFSKNLTSKVQDYQSYLSEEKVYLHLDRTYFQSGENVWFQVYVRDAISLKPSEKSNVVYVQLIDNAGKIEQTRSLVVKEGVALGDFNLKYKEKGGAYKIRAFTNWQRNRNEYFERIIQIEKQSNGISFDFQFDETSYKVEDTVSVQVKLKNGNENHLGKTLTYYVEIDGKKLKSNTTKLNKEGIAKFNFKLPGAFANFEGLLNVQLTGSKKRFIKVIPGGCKNIDLQFMPEGGDLIAGHEINTAFKAINEFGHSVDVNGVIFNSNGKKVTTFTTYHSGMGGFSFVPKPNEEYFAKITGPDEIEHKYFLPEVLSAGYSIKIEEKKKNGLGIKALSPREEKAILVVRSADNIILTKHLELNKGWTEIDAETKDWPAGINQITLFDQFFTPQSERLVFVNKNKLPSIEIQSDKQVYQPREKVALKVKVKDSDNKPVNGQFSLSVVNKGLKNFSNDKQGHILSYMLLESELNGEIENPNFYFNDSEPKAEKALDYLMMTHGYRRFSWIELENEPQIAQDYPGETSLIKGQVLDAANQPIPNAIIEVANSPIIKKADDEGNFMLADLDLSNAIQLNISAKGYPTNWHQVFMYYDDLKLGLNEYPTAIRDLTKYPEGVVPPMYPRTSRVVGLEKGVKTEKKVLKTQEKETKLVVVPPKFKTVKKEVQVESGTNNKPPKFKQLEEKQLVEGVSTELVTVPASYDTLTKKINTQDKQPKSKPLTAQSVSYKAKDWRLVKDKRLKHPNFKHVKGNYFAQAYKEHKTGTSYQITKKRITVPATNNIQEIPAEYKTVIRKELIKPEALEPVVVEAEYKTVSNKILVKEATDTEPAVYEVQEEKVLVKPAYTSMVTVPAEYKEIEEKVETAPAYKISISKPAEYKVYQENVSEADFNSYSRKFKYGFYRARSFYNPKYKKETKSKIEDNRTTLHWQPSISLDKNGEATVEFYNGDEFGTFSVNVEGITNVGKPGLGATNFLSRTPVTLSSDIPKSLKVGDLFTVPVSISNNLEQTITGTLKLDIPKGFKVKSDLLKKYSIEGFKTVEIPIAFEVVKETSGDFSIDFKYEDFQSKNNAFINVHNNIYNVLTFGGAQTTNTYKIDDIYLEENDLSLNLRIYPSAIAELIDLKQRWENQTNVGFEDEIASIELNLVALEFLTRNETSESNQLTPFKQALSQQLEKLDAYKYKSGYFWKKPGTIDLKATALAYSTKQRASEFVPVNEEEQEVTKNWMLDKRGKKNLFKAYKKQPVDKAITSSLAVLKAFSYSPEIQSTLTESIDQIFAKVVVSKDNYAKALLANILFKNNDQRGHDLFISILEKQAENGAWIGSSKTLLNKTGRTLTLETTALMLENIRLSNIGQEQEPKAIEYLLDNQYLLDTRPDYTYLKLKEVLLNKMVFNSQNNQKFTMMINGKLVADKSVDFSKFSNLIISNLSDHLNPEESNSIELKFEQSGLTHRVEIRAKNRLEQSYSNHVEFEIDADNQNYKLGQPIVEKIVIKNTSDKIVKYPILIAEIPGGLICPEKFLKEISNSEQVLRHEYKEGKLILFLSEIGANKAHTLPLEFYPKMEGEFKGVQLELENNDRLIGFYASEKIFIEK